LRIGVLTTSYPRHPGDSAGGFVRELNRYLLRRGHEVEVLAAGDPAVSSAPARDADGALVLRLPSSLFYRGGAPDALHHGGARALAAAASFQLRLLLACARRVRRYDALISHWVVPSALAATLCGGRRPHVAIAHSSDIHLLRRLRLTGLGRLLSRRARLVYTSASLKLAGAPGVVAPMGVTVREFAATAEERAAARHALGLTGPTVLALGRLVPVKGLAGLLTAMAALPEATLVVAGDGPLRPALTAQAAPLGARVRFVGEVAGPLRRQLLHGCDVLALPSLILPDGRTESAPLVLLEALAAGCPIVASAVGGTAELVGDAGLLVPPQDPVALAAALQKALYDPGWSAACRRRAAQRAARFDWSVVAPAILGPLPGF
jgi:glycosyltransferase involved in cell wall biosynthesis